VSKEKIDSAMKSRRKKRNAGGKTANSSSYFKYYMLDAARREVD
jgi:hypothetical protein